MSTVVAELLAELGGVCRRSALLRVVDRRTLERAVAAGEVVRDGRGVYRLPGADHEIVVATRLGGSLALTSAAVRRGWAVKTLPDKPYVTVSRGRRLRGRVREAHVRFAELGPHDTVDGVTSAARNLSDCLRHLPFDEALCVADSALREDGCHQLLQHLADTARGPGSVQLRRVASAARAGAANPFESVLRAICLGVPGLSVQPQVEIPELRVTARVDLADVRLRIVVEAESFAWHAGRERLASDCRRYTALVVGGWWVVRFGYADVMDRPDYVREVLTELVALAELLNKRAVRRRKAA